MNLSEEFEKRIYDLVKGFVQENTLNSFLYLIDETITGYPQKIKIENGLLRLFSSILSFSTFVKESIVYKHYIPTLITLISNSNYLLDILVRNPEYIYWLLTNGGLNNKLNRNELSSEIKKNLSVYSSFNSKVNFLIRLKRREILKIGARDLNHLDSIVETTLQLSDLAEELLSSLFNLCYNKVLSEYQITKTNRKYAVITLGKLGGRELNYSSDVDLIVIVDKNLKVKDGLTYYEIVSEVIKLFIEKASSLTPEGYLYRIDFRLRPDGKNSPICRTINDTLRYYETRGENWEKQMLIKMNFLTGDKRLYNNFYNNTKSFIYHLDPFSSVTEQVYELRKITTSNYSSEVNVKQSKGGIRDIEFPIQILQMINGGKNASIQTGNTFEAISKLYTGKLLTNEEQELIKESYTFFRRIEHFLQLLDDRQTHTIPESGEVLDIISHYFGFQPSYVFSEKVYGYMTRIALFADSVYMSPEIEKSPTERSSYIIEGERAINFLDTGKAKKSLLYLKEGKGLLQRKDFDKITSKSYLKIEPFFLRYLSKSTRPDTVLNNFVRVIKNSRFPSIWYESFQSEKVFAAFLKICEYSQKAIDLFAEDKELRELFLDGTVFEPIASDTILSCNMKMILFILLVQYSNNLIDYEEIGRILSLSVKTKIIKIISGSDDKLRNLKYFICGLGSFSVEQMTFNSDIDIIFVCEASDTKKDIQKIFIGILESIRLNVEPFKIDCRLRPEGNLSQIVWNIETYISYINKRAKIWEMQSLTKMNYICGDSSLFLEFSKSISLRIEREDESLIKKEIRLMRQRIIDSDSTYMKLFNIKKSKGGITDIEFTVQYLLLKNSSIFNQLRGGNMRKVILGLTKHYPEVSSEINLLFNNYQFLINLHLLIQSIFNLSSDMLPKDIEKIKVLTSVLKLNEDKSLDNMINEISNENIRIFDFITEGKRSEK